MSRDASPVLLALGESPLRRGAAVVLALVFIAMGVAAVAEGNRSGFFLIVLFGLALADAWRRWRRQPALRLRVTAAGLEIPAETVYPRLPWSAVARATVERNLFSRNLCLHLVEPPGAVIRIDGTGLFVSLDRVARFINKHLGERRR